MLGLSCGMWDLCCHMRTLRCDMRDLVPRPAIEPRPSALGAWSLTHWTTREVPFCILFSPFGFLELMSVCCPKQTRTDQLLTSFTSFGLPKALIPLKFITIAFYFCIAIGIYFPIFIEIVLAICSLCSRRAGFSSCGTQAQ